MHIYIHTYIHTYINAHIHILQKITSRCYAAPAISWMNAILGIEICTVCMYVVAIVKVDHIYTI